MRRVGISRTITAWCLLLVVQLGLALSSYRRLRRWFGAPRALPPAPEPVARHVAGQVRLAARWLPRPSCLARALAAQWLLARKGYGSDIHIGVADLGKDGRFTAHAWLSCGGATVLGGDVPDFERYAPLFDIR